MQRWLFFQSAHVTPACMPVMRATNPVLLAFWKAQPDLAAAEAGRKELARFLPVLEQQLGKRDWLEGAFSLADIAHAPHLLLVAKGGFDFASYPNLSAWLARLRARPAWQRVDALLFDAK